MKSGENSCISSTMRTCRVRVRVRVRVRGRGRARGRVRVRGRGRVRVRVRVRVNSCMMRTASRSVRVCHSCISALA